MNNFLDDLQDQTLIDAIDLIKQDQKIEAIKLLRDKAGLGLKEAKDLLKHYPCMQAQSAQMRSSQMQALLNQSITLFQIPNTAKILARPVRSSMHLTMKILKISCN